MRIPAGLPAVTAECLLYGDVLACAVAVRGEDARREAVITLRHPLQLAGELCVRLRAAGWEIRRLDAEMTAHDAAIAPYRLGRHDARPRNLSVGGGSGWR